MRIIFLCWLSLMGLSAGAQNTLRFVVEDEEAGTPLEAAVIRIDSLGLGAFSDEAGKAEIGGIPDGTFTLKVSYLGYAEHEQEVRLPEMNGQELHVALEHSEEHEEDVIISTGRSSRTIEDIPTRVEVIAGEELEEKAMMNSSNIAMLLRESTGIQVQQTSASSGTAGIRIQGLDGRYTQLMRDGFPLYGGYSGGLSLMQIPPLDLQQVEVVKGSASTLYGGGAIAGIVNLITKTPGDEPELLLMADQTSALRTSLNGFYSQREGNVGWTVYAAGSHQEPYDPNKDDFSDLPYATTLTLNPRLFFYLGNGGVLTVGGTGNYDLRTGGDMFAIRNQFDSTHTYFEQNISRRVTGQVGLEQPLGEAAHLTLKHSSSYYDRDIWIANDDRYLGRQLNTYSEASVRRKGRKADWVGGLNLWTDRFRDTTGTGLHNYDYLTLGAFLQHTWSIHPLLTLESGLRGDYNNAYGFLPLSRAFLMWKATPGLTVRGGGGLGYRLPTIFQEETERIPLYQVRPLDLQATQLETSQGASVDLNIKGLLSEQVAISANQMFFYTRLDNPLFITPDSTGVPAMTNGSQPVISAGAETNLRLKYRDFKMFLNYAFVDTRELYRGDGQKPLTPRHSAGMTLVWEKHDDFRIGYELYYTGTQTLDDGSNTRPYWVMGLMGMKNFGRVSLYLNFENFTDTRQSRYETIVLGSQSSPSFAQVWAPRDGIVVNGGFILKLGGEHHDHGHEHHDHPHFEGDEHDEH